MGKRKQQCPGCRELRQEVAALRLVVAQQAELIRELQARLGLNSRNSSRPPSSDPPAKPPARPSQPTGRKRGGQPGHEGTTRATFPPADVDAFVELHPSNCRNCAAPLRPDATKDPAPIRHRVVEITSAAAIVTEYVLHRDRSRGRVVLARAPLRHLAREPRRVPVLVAGRGVRYCGADDPEAPREQ